MYTLLYADLLVNKPEHCFCSWEMNLKWMSDYLFGMPGWCLEWHFANVLLLSVINPHKWLKVEFLCVPWGSAQETGCSEMMLQRVKWTIHFGFQFFSLHMLTLETYGIEIYREIKNPLLIKCNFALHQWLKLYVAAKWVIIYSSWSSNLSHLGSKRKHLL